MNLLCFWSEGKTVISITNQQAFDLLPKKIEELVSQGENKIVISLSAGNYIFKDKHIRLTNIDNPRLSILIKGNNTILIPEGKTYIDGDLFEGVFSIYHGWMNGKNDISIWSSMIQSNQLVEIVDFEKKLCRLKSPIPLKDAEREAQYILLTQWYKSNTYCVTKIKDNYIYFIASDLSNSSYKKTEYSINDDFNYLSKYPRYKLCNVADSDNAQSILIKNGEFVLPFGISEVHECIASTFLYLENCNLGFFKMEGLDFWGSSYGYTDAFITFKETKAPNIEIHKCSFYGMHNNVISLLNTNNVIIAKNTFYDIYFTGIYSDNKCQNTRIINNSFFNAGLGLSNTFCILCCGLDYYIEGNKMENYGYGGIRVGIWYLTPQYNRPSGTVENNTLVFTNTYLKRISTDGLMDGGAIYISTINDKAIVRYNYINGFSGAGGNRGIFCDDGALGYEIYGNVILNISRNDYCIASRREPAVEKRNDSRSELLRSNINNTIRDNILDGKIMFRGHEDTDNGCEKGANYVVLTAGKEPPVNQIDYIHQLKSDVIIKNIIIKDNTIMVPRTNYRAMKKSKEWHILRQYLKLM